MRKLSCKWPIWLTLFAVSAPVFYVLFRVGKPEIFNTTELGEKVLGAIGIAAIVWLFYGIACLMATPLCDTSTKKPWKQSDGIHIETREIPESEQRKLEEEQSGVAEPEQARAATPVSQFVERELDKRAHKKGLSISNQNNQEAHRSQENEGMGDKQLNNLSPTPTITQKETQEVHGAVNETQTPGAEQMKTRTGGRFLNSIGWMLLGLGWILIVVSCLAFVGFLQQPRYRDPSIESLLTRPDGSALACTIGLIVGVNFPPIFACLFGVYALARRNPSGKVLILASAIVFLVNSVYLFLPSSESAGASHYDSIVATIPRSEFTVTFPHPVKKKVVTAAGFESIAYENEDPESTPYLRAEFMQGIDTTAIANNFRAILENHARLAGLSLPEITETEGRLGKVGTYAGIKKVGDFTMKIYGKMVLGESSAVNCMVGEQLENFPSEDTVSFLASIKRK